MENNMALIAQCEEKAKQWLSPAFDEETRKQVQEMLDNEDKTALIDAFYQNLEFGTGGLRGIMGAGTNRMNKYIVGMATQGFANYILKAFPGQEGLSVVVGHDCRNNSRLFAETVAAILSGRAKRQYGVISSDCFCADISRRGVRNYTLFKSALLASRCGDGGDNGVHGEARFLQEMRQLSADGCSESRTEYQYTLRIPERNARRIAGQKRKTDRRT